MANAVNIFNFAGEDLAAFLAKPVSNGTYADVFGTLKFDQAGEEASATEIQQYAGQLLGNGVDDFIQAAYPYIRQIAQGGVTPNSNAKDTIPGEVVIGSDTVLATGLSQTPLADSVTLDLNGIVQVEGSDYLIVGTSITWLADSGTAVDLDPTDQINVQYQY
jgi:hypothetical protein